MSEARDYILTVDLDLDAALKSVQQLSDKLQAKQTSLLDVVQSLGEYINDQDPSTRAKAIKLLVQVVKSLPPQFLSRQQILVLCDFLCERIEDGNAPSGLEMLSNLPRFNSEMAVNTFRAMCEHFSELQTRPQASRYEVLILLNTLLNLHRSSLRELGLDSLTSVLDLVAGERDPRNLMVIFSFLAILISEWDIRPRAEEVFDAVFCYFPITFRPPPNDPYGITAQDLKQRLENCLSASAVFASYVFPQLIDKLDSTAINAKKDVLRVISACAKSYGGDVMSNYSVAIWDSLKYEIFNAQEEELADEALLSLTSLAQSLVETSAIHNSKSYLNEYLEPVAKECNERLLEPQQKQAQPAARIVGALASTSAAALSYLLQACLPPLLTLYQDAGTFEKRRAVLSAISSLLQASTKVGADTLGPDHSTPLLRFKETLSDLLLQAVMHKGSSETIFRTVAIESSIYLCLCPGLLDNDEINLFGRHLCEIVIQEEEASAQLRTTSIEALSTLSTSNQNLISEVILPTMFSKLPDSLQTEEPDYRVLNALACLKLDKGLSGTLLRRLLNKTVLIFEHSGPSQYFCAALATVNTVTLKMIPTDEALTKFCAEKILALTYPFLQKDVKGDDSLDAVRFKSATMLGRFICLAVRSQDSEFQTDISKQIFPLLHDDPITEGDSPRGRAASPEKGIIRTYLLAGLKTTVPLPYSQQELLGLLDNAIEESRSTASPLVRLNLLQQLALLVNKFIDKSNLSKVEERLWATEHGILRPGGLSRQSIRTGFWIIKGLCLRLANVTDIMTHLVELLSDSSHGTELAFAFELILHPDEVVSRENGATIRLISPQKIFSSYLAEISKPLSGAKSTEKSNYLTALAGLLKYLNSDLVMLQKESLLPLLSQALVLDNPPVIESAIRTLTVIAQGSAETLESHAPSLINRLIMTTGKLSPDMIQARHFALVALQNFATKIKSTVLMPYRQAVLNGIRICLDDPKRFVRKDAVDCRSAWMSLDEPDDTA